MPPAALIRCRLLFTSMVNTTFEVNCSFKFGSGKACFPQCRGNLISLTENRVLQFLELPNGFLLVTGKPSDFL